MSTTEHLLLAFTKPAEGKEDAFNEWYDAYHVPECLKVPGFKSGRRFKLSASRNGEPELAYLALYELEGEDPDDLLDRLTSSSGERTQSESYDRPATKLWVFSAIGDKLLPENE